ncbi:hypothetical protein DQ384_04805 [Sphaerisporangium album]|uniref:Uncharacterized protein n=1 Tax=Sphaerisporangium album TaxID=509200 RepID=A0A367FQY1_9ACTN|nr:hypothetical protein [Sphaerisporangium album]RCG32793.1 hypothetical protein DQ384_04805 [Sphaerisporangium album]
MRTEVFLSELAQKQAGILRGPDLKALDAFIRDLEARGCAALGYRLTGDVPVSRLCVKHLRNAGRAVVAFEEPGRAWVLLIGAHDERDRARDVYAALWKVCGLEAPPSGRRTKPACCDDDGADPLSPEVDDLVTRCRDLARPVRRRR